LDRGELIRALEAQIKEAKELKSKRYDCPELNGWLAKTKSLIRKANEPDFLPQFEALRFWSPGSFMDESREMRLARNQRAYDADLTAAESILRGLIEVLGISGPEAGPRKKPRMGFLKEEEEF